MPETIEQETELGRTQPSQMVTGVSRPSLTRLKSGTKHSLSLFTTLGHMLNSLVAFSFSSSNALRIDSREH